MCMIDDGEKAELWSERWRTARKPNRCDECRRPIAAGERYVYLFGKQEGDVFTGRWCAHCDVAKEWLWENCSGSMLTMVIEDIQHHVEDYRGHAACVPRLHRIVLGASRHWIVKRGPRAGQLMPLPKPPANLEPKHAH